MQQTEKYKLNLIEPSDPFLPDALNRNTQKVEDAMSAHEARMDGQAAALDQRVKVLEGHKIAYGTYKGYYSQGGDNTPQFISLPFTPRVLLIFYVHVKFNMTVWMEGMTWSELNDILPSQNGFYAKGGYNSSGLIFPYIALR